MSIEGFTALLNSFEDQKLISGIKVATTPPPITHMFFADDSYIFCIANMESAEIVMQLLRASEQASCRKLNVEKSSVFFSNNTADYLKRDLGQNLMFREAND